MSRYIDAHCHLQHLQDLIQVLETAESAGICGFVCNSTKPDDWTDVIKVTEKSANIYGCIGVHPWYASDLPEDWRDIMYELLQMHKQLMVGEIGLDKFASVDMNVQVDIFKTQLEIASKLNRSVNIHCVGAWDKMLRLLKECTVPVILHSFAASEEIIKQLLKSFNIYYSFSPDLLDNKHVIMTNAVKIIPIDKILVESDEKSPLLIPEVITKIAELKSVDSDVIADKVYNNSLGILKHGQIA